MSDFGFPNQYNKVDFKYPAKNDFISVVIPVYKDYLGLKDTLESLTRQSFDKNGFEIIVVNDGADAKIRDIREKYDVKIIEISPNKGPANARNRGMEESSGEFIAFIDADTKAVKSWLKTGFSALKKSADYVGGPIKIDKTRVKTIANYYDLIDAFKSKHFINTKHFLPTANLFIKRKIAEEIGGFDVRLITSEDVEFGDRVHYFTDFRQLFLDINTIKITHPPRSHKELIGRQKAYAEGLSLLTHIYPKRFKKNYLKSFTFMLTPPVHTVSRFKDNRLNGVSDKIKLLSFGWLLRYTQNYYKIKYYMKKPPYQMKAKND